jgi:hypothetical protein
MHDVKQMRQLRARTHLAVVGTVTLCDAKCVSARMPTHQYTTCVVGDNSICVHVVCGTRDFIVLLECAQHQLHIVTTMHARDVCLKCATTIFRRYAGDDFDGFVLLQ